MAWLSSRHPFHRPSARHCPSVPFPQRQQIPRFGAVVAWLSSPRPFCRPSVRHYPSVPFPQRQQIPRFSAVAESHSAWPLPQALSSYTLSSFHLLPPSPPSSTFRRCAEFPCFRLTFRRCAESSLLRERPMSAFLLPPCVSHLPKVRRIPVFSSHLPKVRGVVTASRAPCVRVSPAAVRFPPSEGVQYSRVFVPPSEGVQFQNEKAGCALS